MRFIGDVHGKLAQYYTIAKGAPKSIQAGDLGFQREHDWFISQMDIDNHKVLFGNHDYYPYVDKDHSLGNFGIYEDIFFVRGAYSIDIIHRRMGRDWFDNEELTYRQGIECLEMYVNIAPSIVISHDCPAEIRRDQFGIYEKSLTSDLLQIMFEEHQPEQWYFGHHHKSIETVTMGTYFRCLAELEYVDL